MTVARLVALASLGLASLGCGYWGEYGTDGVALFALYSPCSRCEQLRTVTVGSSAAVTVSQRNCAAPVEVTLEVHDGALWLEPRADLWGEEDPCSASFSLHADAPGSATLSFNGGADRYAVGAMEAATFSIGETNDASWASRVDIAQTRSTVGGFVNVDPYTFGPEGELLIPPFDDVVWTSSDERIVSQTHPDAPDLTLNGGMFWALAEGTATITARFRDLTATVEVVVGPPE